MPFKAVSLLVSQAISMLALADTDLWRMPVLVYNLKHENLFSEKLSQPTKSGSEKTSIRGAD